MSRSGNYWAMNVLSNDYICRTRYHPVCKARDTQRPCSHPGHSHFQGHCQIVQFIISVSTYVHGDRLYTVKPRCLLTSAIVDFFSEKKNCLGFHQLPWISPAADFAKTKSDPPVVLPGVPPV